MELLSRFAFSVASIMLMLLALGLMGYGILDLGSALFKSWRSGRDAVILAISYVVIAVAVFDVAKYFIEEEVLQTRNNMSATEARASLTKFITTIIIAIFIEGLVSIFEVSKEDIEKIFYPIGLLVTATFMVLALTVYQKFSVNTERL
ncbi:hypothetical protein [Acetobacter sp.]|jgi:hypothetical protein|uniref:hypothetical protein n=1 Tax=Acetobacter sp. TaxID=440 RepID=UPI0025BAAFB5|nr:hypothetical protein [Acetobacter sp.]MCH4091917.1 hypothetical protein [Acetobacter sp.]MCI1317598.1 hypothetical protein [Acetobacter sp.]